MVRRLVLMVLAGLLIAAPAVAGQVVIKLGNVQATADIVQTGLQKFADLVKERSKGELQREFLLCALGGVWQSPEQF